MQIKLLIGLYWLFVFPFCYEGQQFTGTIITLANHCFQFRFFHLCVFVSCFPFPHFPKKCCIIVTFGFPFSSPAAHFLRFHMSMTSNCDLALERLALQI